jgi:hypothetical protein
MIEPDIWDGVQLGKLKTWEIIIRGDIAEKNIILKLGQTLRKTDLNADFTASIAVPPFVTAMEKHHPSVCVVHTTIDREHRFELEKLLKEFLRAEDCELVSMCEL